MNSNSQKIVEINYETFEILVLENNELPTIKTLSSAKWKQLFKIEKFSHNDGSFVCLDLAKQWEFMPSGFSQRSHLIKRPLNQEVIFYSGSFNPWHRGHEQCLKLLNKNNNVFIVPDNNPRKTHEGNQEVNQCSWEKYRNLLKNTPKEISVYPGFWATSKSNPTAHWVPSIKNNFPQLSLCLLIGFDSFLTIDTWIEASKLLNSLNSLYIVSRMDDENLKKKQIIKLENNFPHINMIFLGHHPYEKISSTKIRNAK